MTKLTLKDLRFEHEKMTQKQLASLLHVERSTISKWENGTHAPSREITKRIAVIFDKPYEEIDAIFLGGNDNE